MEDKPLSPKWFIQASEPGKATLRETLSDTPIQWKKLIMMMNKLKTILLASSVAASAGFIFTPASHANDCEQIHDQLRVCFDVVGDLIIDNGFFYDTEQKTQVNITLKAAKEQGSESFFESDKHFAIYHKFNNTHGSTTRSYIDCTNRVFSEGIETDQNGGLIPYGDSAFTLFLKPVHSALISYFCDGSYITSTPELPTTEPTYSPAPSNPNPSPSRPTLRETLSDTPFQWKQ